MQLKYLEFQCSPKSAACPVCAGDSRNSGCELGRFVALLQLNVIEAGQVSWGLWLKGEEGAVLGTPWCSGW